MLIKETKIAFGETNTRTRGHPNAAPQGGWHRRQGLRTGTVFMLKTVYAIVAAAIIAACLVLAPSLSPQVEAGAPSATGKADRADAGLLAVEHSDVPDTGIEAND